MSEPTDQLPDSPGFYWWRRSGFSPWRMVQIIDLAAGLQGETSLLMAYDVEKNEWRGRTLKLWASYQPIGQWLECVKPSRFFRGTPNEETKRSTAPHQQPCPCAWCEVDRQNSELA